LAHIIPRNVSTIVPSKYQLLKTSYVHLRRLLPQSRPTPCSRSATPEKPCHQSVISVDQRGEKYPGRGLGCRAVPGLHAVCVATGTTWSVTVLRFGTSVCELLSVVVNSLPRQTALVVHRKHVRMNILGQISFRKLKRSH
jgi:hypothetical protein